MYSNQWHTSQVLGKCTAHSTLVNKETGPSGMAKLAPLRMAASTPDGIVIPVTAPFGFHGLPAQFQYLMTKHVFEGIEGN